MIVHVYCHICLVACGSQIFFILALIHPRALLQYYLRGKAHLELFSLFRAYLQLLTVCYNYSTFLPYFKAFAFKHAYGIPLFCIMLIPYFQR